MYPVSAQWAQLVDGSHRPVTTAQSWYGQSVTASLDVVDGSYSASFDGDKVRQSMSLEVDERDGELLPVAATDPLAPYGQQVSVRQAIHVGDWAQDVPVGTFLIDNPEPRGEWVTHHGRALRMGGKVALQCPDRMTRLSEAALSGLVQPLPGATVASETARLCQGLVPVDLSTIPTLALSGKGMVYDSDRLSAVLGLARLVGRVPRMSRAGLLEFVAPVTGTPVWDVTVPAGRWIDAALAHTRDGIYNAVEAVGEDVTGTTAARGYARDLTTSPYSVTSPLGERLLRWSSPLLRTTSAAVSAAATMLANRIASRQVTFKVSALWNPALDVLDTHRVTVIPARMDRDALAVSALCIGIEYSVLGGAMELTYSAPRDQVVAWTR